EAAALVIIEPLLEIMKARGEDAIAAPAAVTVELDHTEKLMGRRVFRTLQHPRRAERDLEKRPAIHAGHVHARSFDPVVELKRVVLVGGSHQGEPNSCGSLTDRQCAPL